MIAQGLSRRLETPTSPGAASRRTYGRQESRAASVVEQPASLAGPDEGGVSLDLPLHDDPCLVELAVVFRGKLAARLRMTGQLLSCLSVWPVFLQGGTGAKGRVGE